MNLIAAYERRCAQVYVAAKQEADKMTRSELEAVLAETEPHSVLSWVNFFAILFTRLVVKRMNKNIKEEKNYILNLLDSKRNKK